MGQWMDGWEAKKDKNYLKEVKNGTDALKESLKSYSELEKAGYMAGVYCSTYWYTYFVDESVRLKRPAFIADYRGRCYYKASYGIWQHGYGNNVPGINANCDLDWGYVDYSQYIKANHLNGF